MFEADGKARPGETHVFEHAPAERAETALLGQLVQRLGLLGRPVVMGIAVSEHETTNPIWMSRSEDLRDPAAAVIGNDVDLIKLHGVAEGGKHRSLGVERKILVAVGGGGAVG